MTPVIKYEEEVRKMVRRRWVVASLAVTAALVLGARSASADRTPRQAQLTSFSGSAEWQPAGSDTWQPATLELQLASGDKVRTGQDGQASLSLDDGSRIALEPGSDFVIQSLSDDVIGQSESIFGLWAGRLTATVTPVAEGSVFQFETPTTTVNVVGTTLTITINPDGSVAVASGEGAVELSREGDYRMHLALETGEEALIEFDPATAVLRVTDLKGIFEVVGPDNVPITLADGDSVVFSGGGAATFIPGTPPVRDVPAMETIGEPIT